MQYAKVVMILNLSDYKVIANTLKKLHIPGISVSTVHGYGDYVNDYNENGFSESMKIEIYTTQKQAEEIVIILSELANDMTEGGGVVAIEPVHSLLNVRKIKQDC